MVRRFGLPTGLEPGDRVLLRLRHSGSRIAARLNTSGLPLTTEPDGIHQSDITGLLSQRNELVVELTPPSPAPSDSTATVLKATLEIHSA